MEAYEKQIIKQAYKRCYGLQLAVSKYIDSKDNVMVNEIIKTLAYQTGLRVDYIRDNKQDILNIN